jgi:anti-sigma-K factor RskA
LNIEEIISSGLLELYAIGMTSPGETVLVENALKDHPEVRQELNKIEMSLESFARVNSMEPSPSVKGKILAQVSQAEKIDVTGIIGGNSRPAPQPAEKNLYRIPSYFKYAAAASLILLIGSLVLDYSYYNKYQQANEQLQAAQNKIDQNQQANLAMKNELNVMSDKNAIPIVLNGTRQAPDALAKIYWMKNTGEVYVDPTNLPAAPEGKQYQLWAIIDGKPVDGGMITTKNGIYHIQKMKSFGHADAFAITLEKAGGNPTPQGEMFVMAKI